MWTFVFYWIYFRSDYLKACALVRKGRAKEACDNAHDCLCYITLQRGVRMFPVTGVVAYLGNDRECVRYNAHRITLPACVHQLRHCGLLGNILPTQIMRCKKRAVVLIAHHHVFAEDVADSLPYKCPPGSSQITSTCGWRCKSPSSPPLCQHSSGSRSWYKLSSPVEAHKSRLINVLLPGTGR